MSQAIVAVVRVSERGYRAEQGADYFPASCAETVAPKPCARHLQPSRPAVGPSHVHARHESAFYLIESGYCVKCVAART